MGEICMSVQTKNNSRLQLRILCEGALMVAASVVLSFFKIQFLLAGSINFAMIPIIIFAVRWGCLWGMGAGAVYGTLKFLLGGYAFSWASILLDYTIAYGAVGLAGLCKSRGEKSEKWGWRYPLGAAVGCFARFVIHFISGITIYRIYEPTQIMGVTTGNAWLYSLLYNISYMLPNTIIAIVVCVLLMQPLLKMAPSRRLV